MVWGDLCNLFAPMLADDWESEKFNDLSRNHTAEAGNPNMLSFFFFFLSSLEPGWPSASLEVEVHLLSGEDGLLSLITGSPTPIQASGLQDHSCLFDKSQQRKPLQAQFKLQSFLE